MKENEFNKILKEINFYDGLIIKIYYSLDENDNIILDIESMTEEFNNKIDELLNMLDGVKD